MRSKTVSLEIERYVLGSILKAGKNVIDFIISIKKEWFASKSHQQIFEAITYLEANKRPVSNITLIEYFNNLGITDLDEVPISEYVEILSSIYDLKLEDYQDYVSSLRKYYIARKAFDSSKQLQKKICDSLNSPIEDIIKLVQTGFSDIETSDVSDSLETTDIFGNVRDLLEVEEEKGGIIPPFDIFYKMYGEFVRGNCYAFIAGYGDGKSTMLDYIAKKCLFKKKNNCKVLYIDTELTPRHNIHRFFSCLTGENERSFRKGLWKNNPELVEEVEKYIEMFESKKGSYHYKTAESADAKTLVSIIRRWYSKNVENDEIPFIIYDYMKVTGEKISNAWDEYNLLGEKTDALQQLARELDAVVLFAVQTNNEGKIAASRRINWFVANSYFLQRKTPEQIQEHGEEFGTHIVIPDKTRFQGEVAAGFNDYIKVPKGDGEFKYEKNFINFEFKNFKVTECGSYQDVLNKQAEKLALKDE